MKKLTFLKFGSELHSIAEEPARQRPRSIFTAFNMRDGAKSPVPWSILLWDTPTVRFSRKQEIVELQSKQPR